ncbi:MAG: DNA polymerase III subunit delta [Patescibacteria group bacterium]
MDLLILHGDDTFSSRQRLRTLVAGFQKKYDPTGGNIVRFSPPFELGQMRNAIAQVGMFAKKRLVVLNDFLRTASVADSTQFNSWFADPTAFPDAVVICWEGKDLGKPTVPKKPAKPKKATAKKAPPKAPTKVSWPEHAKVELFLPLAEAQLAGWIRKEVQRLGGLIEPNAVHLLMANVGADLWRLSNIIAQLVAAAGKAPIDVHLINQWTQAPHDDNMFHFTDALAARNLPAALKLMHGQILLGVHPLVLHAMLVRQIRILLMVADCVERGSAPGAIAEETDLHPFVAQKAVAAVRQFPKGRLAQLFQDVVQLEVDMKTGKVDPEIGLTHFLTKVCAG